MKKNKTEDLISINNKGFGEAVFQVVQRIDERIDRHSVDLEHLESFHQLDLSCRL